MISFIHIQYRNTYFVTIESIRFVHVPRVFGENIDSIGALDIDEIKSESKNHTSLFLKKKIEPHSGIGVKKIGSHCFVTMEGLNR